MIQVEKNTPTASVTPTVLLIFDGFGYSKEARGNAIVSASMPTWDWLRDIYPHTLLRASGSAVGLPEGFIGNSEVGHMCLGAGRIVKTSFSKLHESIKDETFFKNKLLLERLKNLKNSGGALHVMGLLSDAGVHSHDDHLYAFLSLAKSVGIERAYVHAFLDGRDVGPKSAKKYLEKLLNFFKQESYGALASLHGRFYAMDRDENWDRVKKSYDVLSGAVTHVEKTFSQVIDSSYKKNITDEFIEPVLLLRDGVIEQGDGVINYNFRPDRSRMITNSFIDPFFDKFKTRSLSPADKTLSFFLSTTRYDENFKKFSNDVLFENEKIENTLLDVISKDINNKNNKKVFIIAETEKYAHVTYFFRGKVDVRLPHETRVLVSSVKAKNYIEHPEMSAEKITQKIVESLTHAPNYFYIANYANCDMVGHSGDFDATVKACECLDQNLKILYDEIVEKRNGTIFLVGDHGNAEEMVDLETGLPKTAHTKNSVPFMVINKRLAKKEGFCEKPTKQAKNGLSVVAPTILAYLGLSIPDEMDKNLERIELL